MAGPLAGIKVIDISAVISGPLCCQVLADQGAQVIKVEPHGIGDLTRIGGYRVGTISAMFAAANRGKPSVALDMSQPAGLEVFRRLVADADVLVQNFRPGAVDRMGIGSDDLHAINPSLIYVSISGFGPTGPYANRRVYDPIIQAIVGLPSIQMSQDIPIPDLMRTLVCDKSTALLAAQAVTSALFARERGTANGQHLQIPMLDSALYWLWPDVFMAHSFYGPDVVPGPPVYRVYRLQPTADGHLVYFSASPAEMRGLFDALGHPEWADDPRFSTSQAIQTRGNFEALGELLNAAFVTFTTDEIMLRLAVNEVPAAKLNRIEDVFTDEQVVHNDAIHTWEHDTVGTIKQARPPVRWSNTQHEAIWSVDDLGQSTETVLRDHGYNDSQLAQLRALKVI